MDIVKIGGEVFDVLVLELEESFNILYSEKTGRTIAVGAEMTLDPLGTFYGHKVTFKRRSGHEDEYDRLYDYVSVPRYDGIPVEIVHNQTTLAYDAYMSQGQRKLKRVDPVTGKVYWDAFSLNIVPMRAQVVPI